MKENEIEIFGSTVIVDDDKVDEYERKLKEDREKERQEHLKANYVKNSGVPQRYLNESIETYRPSPENKRQFERFCGFIEAVKSKKNTKNIVYMSGRFGTGKTHLGCGMIRELGGKLITSLELCITYDSCRDFTAKKTRIDFLKELCSCPVLVIDEIGKGIAKIELEIIPYIVNEFYGSGRLLVFLGNIGQADFFRIIGEAGADRMKEVGIYFTLIGESERGRK